MRDALIIDNSPSGSSIPARIAHGTTSALFGATEQAQRKFWELFTAHIRNPSTYSAYLIAVWRFTDWCGHHGIPPAKVEPKVVADYIENFTRMLLPASVKQYLARYRARDVRCKTSDETKLNSPTRWAGQIWPSAGCAGSAVESRPREKRWSSRLVEEIPFPVFHSSVSEARRRTRRWQTD